MEKKMTAVEWLQQQYDNCPESFLTDDDFDKAKAMERQQMIDFALWLKENDTPENAEMFFGFSDDDMLNYFLNIQQ